MLGDHLKRIILIAVMSLAIISLTAEAQNAEVLSSYEGNISQTEFELASLMGVFGLPGFGFAEAVKFTAPSPGWNLKQVRILGWDGFNGTIESVPVRNVIALEVRDKDLNLLYKLADVQVAYTNYAFNHTGPIMMEIELPSIPVSDEFYVAFYDRGSVGVGFEVLNATNNRSFILNAPAMEIVPAQLPVNDSATPVNWLMEVAGS
jgi:hypothetical protein